MTEIKIGAEQGIIDTFEKDIRSLARTKAIIVKTDVMTEEEAVDFLNKKGREYQEKYDKMNPFSILMDLKIETLERVKEYVSDK